MWELFQTHGAEVYIVGSLFMYAWAGIWEEAAIGLWIILAVSCTALVIPYTAIVVWWGYTTGPQEWLDFMGMLNPIPLYYNHTTELYPKLLWGGWLFTLWWVLWAWLGFKFGRR